MITELNASSGKREIDWVLNIYEADASAGVVIRSAQSGYRHGISKIVIVVSDNEQVSLLNGEDIFIGPLNLEKGAPWPMSFETEVYCTENRALILKTESDFPVHCLVIGCTGVPMPSASPSASPSATE